MSFLSSITQSILGSTFTDVLSGIPRAGSGALLPALDGIAATVAISPRYLCTAWKSSSRATVKVEKGYGSGIFQDLYPSSSGELFTAPNGAGSTATAFAAGAKLLVETPYNQTLASEVAAGHPTAITDASRRVLLDVSIPTAPRFAGIQQGTQDLLQSLTERGYDLNISIVGNTGLSAFSLDAPPATGTTDYQVYTNNGGTSQYMLVNPANTRWYGAPVAVAKVNPVRTPHLKVDYRNPKGRFATENSAGGISGGSFNAINEQHAVTGTSTPIRWLGAASPLTGSCYAFVIVSGSYLSADQVKYSGTIIKALHAAAANVYGANEITLYSPLAYQLFPMSLATSLATIRIICASGPLRQIEASYNGSAYQPIGTTDVNGYLVGSFTNASPGTGTLNVRVVGQATVAATIANVRVGIMVLRGGQSNADERGDNITLTATRSISTNGWTNSTATQKSWIWVLLNQLAAQYSCPVAMAGYSLGASYLYFNAGGSVDGRHGHWNSLNPGTSVVNAFATWVTYAHVTQEEPNFAIWHQGEEDANGAVSSANYESALTAMWTEFRRLTGWTKKLWIMQIGRDGAVPDANVDAIRAAQINAVANRPDLFEAGGVLAHLQCGDGGADQVHFWTQAQKDAVAAVFTRNALGSGRGPRISSAIYTGSTITVTCTGGVSPLTISGGEAASPIGWNVSDGGAAMTITAVSVSGLVITLTASRAFSAAPTLKWLSGDNGIGTTLLDSDLVTPVPPEPFSVLCSVI